MAASNPKALIVIPARLGSTRLPQKMLLRETGYPLVWHTWQAAAAAQLGEQVVVATDAPEIATALQPLGVRCEMTSVAHASGTDRVAEVARRHPEFSFVVNLQGDEPEIEPPMIDLAIQALADAPPEVVIATLAAPLRDVAALNDPACVKVVVDRSDNAIYFSRSVIPHPRQWHQSLLAAEPPIYTQHIGLYVYRREFLLRFSELPHSPIEQIESLEQLRVLYQGHKIRVAMVSRAKRGIDTAEDYAAFVSRWQNR